MSKFGKGKPNKQRKLSQSTLQKLILRYFQKNPKHRLNAKQLKKKLKLPNSKDSISNALERLRNHSLLFRLGEDKYKLDSAGSRERNFDANQSFNGIVDLTKAGSAYIVCEHFKPDVFVLAKNLNGAFDNDEVKVEIIRKRGRRNPEGRVIEIIKRANSQFVGTVQIYKNRATVYVHHPKMSIDVAVHFDELNGAVDGDVATVEILEYRRNRNKELIGRIVKVFKSEDLNEIEMSSILINNGFQTGFLPDVVNEVREIDKSIAYDAESGRIDFRAVPTFTIDPVDAKDFDDAISLREINDQFEVGIHIADVSHFVREGTAMDKAAYEQGTSVYLVDRVCPMLPEILSNDLCSLRPDEDRFCFSVVYGFDREYSIVSEWIGKTIIHSNQRFNYDEASEIIGKGNKKYSKELRRLDQITQKLRKDRFKNGSLQFETAEIQFRLGENAVPLAIFAKERKETHLLVEDLMLLANKSVANFIRTKGQDKEIPFVYRIHDNPDPSKLQELAAYAEEMGFSFDFKTKNQLAQSIAALSKLSERKSEFKLLEIMAIRSMAKAAYSTKNIGHYGLSFENYTHFTSPIRRYSDLLVHRILEKNLNGTYKMDKSILESKCYHISIQERKAQDAERDSIRYKQTEYMQDKLGDQYQAKIGSILDRGFWVVLDDVLIEGLVGYEYFDESFDFPMGKFKAVGNRSGSVYRMGQAVTVQVESVHIASRTVYFSLV